jgi:hypothetical protein
MARRAPPTDPATLAKRALATARCRSRQRRGLQLHEVEAGAWHYDLAIRYGGLREDQTANKTAVNAALGRLFRKALVALLEQEESKQKK